jgi:hypothetical protein
VDEASSSLITEPSDAWEDIPTIEELKEAFKRKTRSPQEEGSEIYGNGNWKFVIIFFNFFFATTVPRNFGPSSLKTIRNIKGARTLEAGP